MRTMWRAPKAGRSVDAAAKCAPLLKAGTSGFERARVAGALALGILGVPVLRLAWIEPSASDSHSLRLIELTRPYSPSEASLRRAKECRIQAQQAVNRERDALEAWDPEAVPALGPEAWRRQLMLQDQSGLLHRARALARHAATLARTPEEAYRAALLQSYLACDVGEHAEEIKQAQAMMALQPQSNVPGIILRRTVRCIGQKPPDVGANVAIGQKAKAAECQRKADRARG